MKKVTILIGDWPGHFIKDLKFFDRLEEKIPCKISKMNEFEFNTRINDNEITFQFCFGPLKDKIWEERKIIRLKEGRHLPPSIEELSKKIKTPDEIYYLGFCGVLNGPVNTFYLPNRFSEILFKKYLITKNSKKEFVFKKEIKIKNNLIGKIKGVKCSCVTSNQVLSLKYVKDNAHEVLSNLSRLISKKADILEMENYEVAKLFSKKCPLGIVLYGGDSPLRKEVMLGASEHSLDLEKFIKEGINLINYISLPKANRQL